MKKYIAILRGINVGGKRKILMTDLKQLFNALGFSNVATYIQSGNVLFSANTQEDENELAGRIEKAIFERCGFEVPVIVRSAGEIEALIAVNPFYNEEETVIEQLHVTFLKNIPAADKVDALVKLDFLPDRFQLKDKNVFLACAAKYSDTKLNNQFFENKLKVPATTRNWKTVLKLAELSAE